MRWLAAIAALACIQVCAADALFESAQRKVDTITQGRAKPGSTIMFTPAEANAWAKMKLQTVVPSGVRNLYLDFTADQVTGTALVDLQKVRQASGIMARMLDGERPVKAIARVASGAGRATVNLTRVELSQVAASGAVLDFLIDNFVRSLYPDVRVNEPVDLDYRVERVEIRPAGVRVSIKR